ncbi:protein FAR1-RELATED SEQUENCE 5-like isoform X2 [Magnolia sinica]|nr:protein FAR1-RELATED SEQUENCE 5-like isoform X2 [Magnolia sinica]XP_058086793.1 protein FAR1-RELATED SEQUENCE 5-like isoform X2 [Magnolia sinica]
MQSATNHDNALLDFHMTPGAETRGGEDRAMMESFEGAENIEPYEGLEFESEDAARVFYNAYARRVGFGSRIGKNLRSRKDGRTIARKFVCSKEGFRAKKHQNNANRVKRPRAVTREGCEAMMMVKKTEVGRWVVTKFTKEHNHVLLSPSEVVLLRSHRNASDIPKGRIKVSDGGRMDASKTMSIFGAESSGISTIEFTEQDYGNHNQTGPKRKRNLGRDIENVLDHFKRMQSENPAFFYAIKVDEGRSLCSMFWADAKSRMACNYFGDVVYFDTIYKMNQYEMLFAIFTGVNHHQQSTVFGCALLLDETESSFTWLFNTWLEAMSGHHPVSIITDPDAAIGAAIAQVFPKTHHIFNKWHILNNAPKQLSHVYVAFPTFQGELEKCINLTETIDEFESCWESLVYRYELRENEWLQLLYNARQKWVPVYLQGTFFAQMPSTVRSDVVNSFFDWYVNASTTLQEFIIQYERALDTWYEKELEEDVQTMHSKSELKTRLPTEKQVAGIYTRKMFLKFQEEIFESLGYIANKVKEDGAIAMYRVAKYEDQKRAHTVTFDGAERRASCSCHMFEFLGILCRHVLKVFTISNVSTLPSPYILERWTRNAKSRDVLDERGVAIQANSRESVNLRYNNLCKQAIRCVEEGAACGESYDVALHALRAAWEKIVSSKERLERIAQLGAPVISGSNQGDIIATHCEPDDTTNPLTLYDPRQLQSWRL